MCADKDLFGDEVIPAEKITKENCAAVIAHKQLIQIHGETPDKRCKACENLIRKHYGSLYFKCALFRICSMCNDKKFSGNI